MLRIVVLLLLLANLGAWGWGQGYLRELGWGPEQQSEPERVTRQIWPEAVRIRRLPGTAVSASSFQSRPAPEPAVPVAAVAVETVCLQAGVFDEAQAATLRAAAAALPADSWQLAATQVPGRWMVYIGKLADADAVRTKRGELRALGVDVDRPGAALEPGLSLGRFGSQEAAERALTELGRKGVRTARVVQERRDAPGYVLRAQRVDAVLRAQLDALPLAGKEWHPCE